MRTEDQRATQTRVPRLGPRGVRAGEGRNRAEGGTGLTYGDRCTPPPPKRAERRAGSERERALCLRRARSERGPRGEAAMRRPRAKRAWPDRPRCTTDAEMLPTARQGTQGAHGDGRAVATATRSGARTRGQRRCCDAATEL